MVKAYTKYNTEWKHLTFCVCATLDEISKVNFHHKNVLTGL